MTNKKTEKGFTLVELLVVISIIAILISVLVANFMNARDRANDSQKIQDLNSVKSALRLYYNDNQTYPRTTGTIESLNLGSTLAAYVSSNIGDGLSGANYQVGDSGDSFTMEVKLIDTRGQEDTDSQLKCGIGVGSTKDGYYMVCAK